MMNETNREEVIGQTKLGIVRLDNKKTTWSVRVCQCGLGDGTNCNGQHA